MMERYMRDEFVFDFGEDDDSGIHWYASVTIDTEYDAVLCYRVTGVYVGGKMLGWDAIDSELRHRIRGRMNSVETAEFLP
jgi:hypothetical protein